MICFWCSFIFAQICLRWFLFVPNWIPSASFSLCVIMLYIYSSAYSNVRNSSFKILILTKIHQNPSKIQEKPNKNTRKIQKKWGNFTYFMCFCWLCLSGLSAGCTILKRKHLKTKNYWGFAVCFTISVFHPNLYFGKDTGFTTRYYPKYSGFSSWNWETASQLTGFFG